MKLFGLNISRERKSTISLDTLIRRLDAAYATGSGVSVTPETCMSSPTVHGIVTAATRRMKVTPVHVYRKVESNGRAAKERLPSHPVERLLQRPNRWQDGPSYWADAVSQYLRFGNHYAFISRGTTGPIRALLPFNPAAVDVKQHENWAVEYFAAGPGGDRQPVEPQRMFHVRGPARNGVKGDSPVMDLREAIGLEMAAERMGASLFGNDATPGMLFKFAQGSMGFKTDEERSAFVEEFQQRYGGRNRFRALLPPKGVEFDKSIPIENDKAQFLETRKYQRTVIAGAFGFPNHLVGDLEKGTFNNVEQQGISFNQNFMLPIVRSFETAMERDLLTDDDRRTGVIIRFNLDAALRGDFKSRQEGLKIQREAGVISANDWREGEGMNPIAPEDGGDEYWRQGPSGQSADGPAAGDGGAAEEDEEGDEDGV